MKRILIVDDDVHIGNMLEESLSKEGYAVSRAYSGTEAVLSVSLCKPDLVLLDLMLPGLSGEEVLPKLRGIPVIVMSAKASVDSKVELLLGGAADGICGRGRGKAHAHGVRHPQAAHAEPRPGRDPLRHPRAHRGGHAGLHRVLAQDTRQPPAPQAARGRGRGLHRGSLGHRLPLDEILTLSFTAFFTRACYAWQRKGGMATWTMYLKLTAW